MARPIDVRITYSATALAAQRVAEEQRNLLQDLIGVQTRSLQNLREINAGLYQMSLQSRNAAAGMGTLTSSTSAFGTELARVAVFANKTFASIAGSVQSLATAIKGSFSNLSGGISTSAGGVASLVSNLGRSVADFIGTGGFAQGLSRSVAAGARGIIGVGTKIGEALIQGIGGAVATLPKVLGEVTKISGAVLGLGTSAIGALGGALGGAGRGAISIGGFIPGLIISGLANAAGGIQKAVGSILQGVTDVASSAFSGIGKIIGDAFGSGIEIIGAFADRAAAILGDVAEKLGDIFGKSLAVGAAIAIPAAFKAASFRDSLASTFGVVVGELDESGFNQLVDRAKGVAKEIGVSLSEVPGALFKTVSPGFKGTDDAITKFEAATRLAAIGNVELSQAIDTVNIALDAYGSELGNAESIASKLFNATRIGRIEIQDLTENLGYVVGIAANAGISFEKLITAINLGQRTLPVSTAVVGLANAIQKLQNPTVRTRLEFNDFFESIQNVDGTLKDLDLVLREVESGGFTSSPAILQKIFPDVRGLRSILAIINSAGEDFKNYNEILAEVNSGTKTFAQVSDVALGSISRAFTRVTTSVISAADAFLEKFKKPITTGINAVGKLFQDLEARITGIDGSFIDDITKRLQEFIGSVPEKLASAGRFFSDTFSLVKRATNSVADFIEETLNIGSAIRSVFQGDIQSAIQQVIGSPAIQGTINFFNSFVVGAKTAGRAIIDEIGGAINKIGGSISAAAGPLAGGVGSLLTSSFSGGGAQSIADTLLKASFGVTEPQRTVNTLQRAGTGAAFGAALGGFVGPLGAGAGAVIGGAAGGIASFLIDDAKVKAINDTVSGIADLLGSIFKQVAEISERTALANRSINITATAVNLAAQYEAKIRQTINEFASRTEPLIRRRSELEEEIALLVENEFNILAVSAESREEYLTFIASQAATEREKAAIAVRDLKVAEKVERIRQNIQFQLEEIEKEEAELKSKLESEKRKIETTIGSFFGTLRSTSAIGGGDETRLVEAIERLIKALDSNAVAQQALQRAITPRELDENRPGLSTRARSSIRRDKRARDRAEVDYINSLFETPAPDVLGPTGIESSAFGFGRIGGKFGSSLRTLAFGGGSGFGVSLPSEIRRIGDDLAAVSRETIKALFEGIRTAGIAAPGLAGASTLVEDLSTGLPGGPGRRERIRGRRGAFEGAGDADIRGIKDAIKSLAEDAGVGVSYLKFVTDKIARSLPGADEPTILSGLLEEIKKGFEIDKDSKSTRVRREKAAEIESDLAKLSSRKDELKGIKPEEEADKLVPKVDIESIRKAAEDEAKKRAEDVKKKFEELNTEYDSIKEQLTQLGEEQESQLTKLREQFEATWGEAVKTMMDNLQLASSLGEKFVEIGDSIRESMAAYGAELQKRSSQVDALFEQFKALQSSVKGK